MKVLFSIYQPTYPELYSVQTVGAFSVMVPFLLNGYFFFSFREVFANFDPIAVSKLNEKKLIAPGSAASSLLSEPKLRAVIENARQTTKVYVHFLLQLFEIELQKMHTRSSLVNHYQLI